MNIQVNETVNPGTFSYSTFWFLAQIDRKTFLGVHNVSVKKKNITYMLAII